jgi:cytidylate kinase
MAIITVSRGTFSGGRKLAEGVAQSLGYRCISREVLVEASGEYGVREERLWRALTQKPGVLERLTLERSRYLAYIRAALMKEVRDEKAVYHGHAGHLLLQGVPHVLRVKVIANMEFRIAAAMEREHLSEKEAERFVRKMDEDRARWTKFLYGADWNDPSLYDIVVNLDRVDLEGAADIVVRLGSMDEYQPTELSQRTISDLVLSTHLRALIAADKSVSDDGIEITSDGGVASISGTVDSIMDADKIRTIVGNTPGVVDLVSKLRVRQPGLPGGAG